MPVRAYDGETADRRGTVRLVIACSQCGIVPLAPDGAAADAAPIDWMVEREERTGRVTVVCPACVRRHARSIEGGLDQAWW
jgi:hypothetical protein